MKFRPHFKIHKEDSSSQQTYSYTPQQLQTAYSVDKISGNLGEGITIAVIIAYHYPNLQSDFNFFCSTFNLPALTLQVYPLNNPVENSDWAVEECLDVEMIHSMAPFANIVVVEATTDSSDDLFAAISYALTIPNVSIVSMSWGGPESQDEISLESTFNVPNVCFFASSGDYYASPMYPSVSQNVGSIGGTSLFLKSNNTRLLESVWSTNVPETGSTGSGSGCGESYYVGIPNSQKNILNLQTRFTPDLSLVGNPQTGVLMYCSAQSSSLFTVGGTSVSCPLFAGATAIANQKRLALNKPMLSTVNGQRSNMLVYLYNIIYGSKFYNAVFYDITQGTNGPYIAGIGFDCSGLGAPNINALVSALTNV